MCRSALKLFFVSIFIFNLYASECDENINKILLKNQDLDKSAKLSGKLKTLKVYTKPALVKALLKLGVSKNVLSKLSNHYKAIKKPRVLMSATEYGKVVLSGKEIEAKAGGMAVVVNDFINLYIKFLKEKLGIKESEMALVVMGNDGVPKSGKYIKTIDIDMAGRSEKVELYEETLDSGVTIFVGHNDTFKARSLNLKERDLYQTDPNQHFTDHVEWEETGVYITALNNKFIVKVHDHYGSNIYMPNDSHTLYASKFMSEDTIIQPILHNFGQGYKGRMWTYGYGDYRIPHSNYPYGVPAGDSGAIDYLLKLLDIDFDTFMNEFEWNGQFVVGKILKEIEEKNLLAGTTVSPGYAGELVQHGYLIDGITNGLTFEAHASRSQWLGKRKKSKLKDINVNIIEKIRKEWLEGLNFGDDLYSAKGVKAVHAAKARNKRLLQINSGLEVDPNKPLFSLVGRLVDQKNIWVLAESVERIVKQGGQVIVAGTKIPGDKFGEALERRLAEIEFQYPGQFKHYNNDTFAEIATLVQAGGDFFPVTPKFEPCGLTDVEAAWLGNVIVGRRTGGVGESKVKSGLYYTHDNPEDTEGQVRAFSKVLDEAIDMYNNRHDEFLKRRIEGLRQNFTWDKSFGAYFRNTQVSSLHKPLRVLYQDVENRVISVPKAIEAMKLIVKNEDMDVAKNYVRLLKRRVELNSITPYRKRELNILERELLELVERTKKSFDGDEIHKHLGVTLTKSGATFRIHAPDVMKVEILTERKGWTKPIELKMTKEGVWVKSLKGFKNGDKYKYRITHFSGEVIEKTDPISDYVSQGKKFLHWLRNDGKPWHSEIFKSEYKWKAKNYKLSKRPRIMEVHPGTIIAGNNGANWREIADDLVKRLKTSGINYVQLMPVNHHNVYKSWGYQVGSFFSPDHRHGTPDDLKYFIDKMHQNRIGVMIDVVVGHFSKDTDTGLGRMGRDGSGMYEQSVGDENWGVNKFDFAKKDVRDYLLSYMRYLQEEYKIDGARVDAIASMTRYDYKTSEGNGPSSNGVINQFAVRFLQEFNNLVHKINPKFIAIAEESHSYPGVTKPVDNGGLGFDYKWEMGGMHHIRKFLKENPEDRDVNDLIASRQWDSNPEVWKENQIHYINSHDEASHPGKYFLDEIEGIVSDDDRLAFSKIMNAHITLNMPGRPMFFMGDEVANRGDWGKGNWGHWWNHETFLNDHLASKKVKLFFKDMFKIVDNSTVFDRTDAKSLKILLKDNSSKVVVSVRLGTDVNDRLLTVMNHSKDYHQRYRVPVMRDKLWKVVLNSDLKKYGGSGKRVKVGKVEEIPVYHDGEKFSKSMIISIPPQSFLMLE